MEQLLVIQSATALYNIYPWNIYWLYNQRLHYTINMHGTATGYTISDFIIQYISMEQLLVIQSETALYNTHAWNIYWLYNQRLHYTINMHGTSTGYTISDCIIQ